MRLFRLRGACGRPQRYMLALAFALGGFLLAGLAQAQVAGTGHDLTSGEGQTVGATVNNNGEVCVYCHTPHAASTDAPAPLWNRNLASTSLTAADRYSSLNTTTLKGTEADLGSISLACLSCHDGVQAMDTIINTPGRGLGTSTSTLVMNGTTNSLAAVGAGTEALRDDHPVSIQYCGGGIDSSDGVSGSIDASAIGNCAHGADYNDPQVDQINNNTVWWLDITGGTAGDLLTPISGGSGTRERTDIFLYSRSSADFGGSGTTEPSVECGSCHDPHVASDDTTASVNFMRVSNEGSAVCQACHNK